MDSKGEHMTGMDVKASPPMVTSESTESQPNDKATMANESEQKAAEDHRDKVKWYARLNPLRRTIIPVPESRDTVSKEYTAGLLSLVTFQWMASLMTVGYNRPLELNDIWLVNPNRSTEMLAARMKENFTARVRRGDSRPLLRAMFDTFKTDFFVGGLGAFTTTLLQVTMPFVLKYLIAFASAAYFAAQIGLPPPHIGQGLGLVFGVSVMQIIGSVGNNHFMYRGLILGGQIRSVLISIIFDKAMHISGRAKAGGKAITSPPADILPGSDAEKEWYAKKLNPNADAKEKTSETSSDTPPTGKKSKVTNENINDGIGWGNGRIINLMSTDTHRIDQSCGFLHMAWTAPLSILITLALLLVNLSYSALAGFAIFFVSMPLMAMSMGALFRRRATINKTTDRRVTLTQEILQAVRFIKYYSWEDCFLSRVTNIRRQEVRSVQILLVTRNLITSVGMSMPIFASMLAFITFSLTHHILDPAPIFSSLALFNQIRMPLTFLPLIIGQMVDSLASINRIEAFLLAEEQQDDVEWDENSPNAVTISNADFTWERTPTQDPSAAFGGRQNKMQQKAAKKAKKEAEKAAKAAKKSKNPPAPQEKEPEKEPFKIQGIDVALGRGELVAVVGTVGCGKSSLLSAIAGDMRQTTGSMTLGATRAFCPQQAWIQNATVEENITFGKPLNKAWFDKVVDACALRPDLEMLPNGRMTEIGERGINLSGGQKQRVNIARAIYFDADIVLMDDPLSAVDAHVGRHIMDEAICGLLKSKCRILATHQLHVLPRCDRIILMAEGKIVAIDTFDNLMANNENFQTIMATVDTKQGEASAVAAEEGDTVALQKAITKELKVDLMQTEDRAVRAVSWSVYHAYVKASGSVLIAPLVLFILALSQAGNIITGLWLAWWTSGAYGLSQGAYIGTYVALGLSQTLFNFSYSMILSVAGTEASKKLHNRGMKRILRAPMSFFDTTPLGRIINRFSKDIDIMDNNLQDAMRMALITLASVLSVFVLIIVYFPYFAIALGPLFMFYLFIASYYRASAREIKRHEAVLRSTVFARFNEAIFGTSTLRAYGLTDQFSKSICQAIDSMDGAYYLTFSNQRWLGVRLDAVGVVIIFITGLLVVTSRFSVPPSIGGLVLSYMISMVQILQFTVRQVAEVENDMNATERVIYYSTSLEEEAPAHLPALEGRESWPEQGELNFENVQMRYRDGLPLVLQDFTLHVKAGERLAIVGRTGAGKSSIMATLFRLVELSSGSITIDGVNISTIGLHDLRSRMSIIPQDPTLFKGTVRSNLDPFEKHTDLELWSALRQANLVETDTAAEDTTGRIQLDGVVEDEGANFSLGQRQLLALARALVRGSQIIVCDEATSSVDFETDRRIQQAIFEGFRGKTLLCIAHRLKTIIGYDRVCVLDHGQVAELGTPMELFEAGGIFRGMCEKNSIDKAEILEAVRGVDQTISAA